MTATRQVIRRGQNFWESRALTPSCHQAEPPIAREQRPGKVGQQSGAQPLACSQMFFDARTLERTRDGNPRKASQRIWVPLLNDANQSAVLLKNLLKLDLQKLDLQSDCSLSAKRSRQASVESPHVLRVNLSPLWRMSDPRVALVLTKRLGFSSSLRKEPSKRM
jgi:hypothetical protein